MVSAKEGQDVRAAFLSMAGRNAEHVERIRTLEAALWGVCGPDELPSYYPSGRNDDGTVWTDGRLHCVFCDGLVEWESEEHKPDCRWLAACAALAGEPCTCSAPPVQPCGPNCQYPFQDEQPKKGEPDG